MELDTSGKRGFFDRIIHTKYNDHLDFYRDIYTVMKDIGSRLGDGIVCDFNEHIQYLFPVQDSNNCTIYALYMLLLMICKKHELIVSLENLHYNMRGIITEFRFLLLKKYYESMDPTTAEYLYKQVVVQLEESKEVTDYANAYSEMKPKEAAAIFEAMTDNLDLAARILGVMDTQNRGKILGAMDPIVASKITKIMEPDS